MSQPKRYSVAVNDPWFGNGAYVAEDGKYVLHSDYAGLAAEKERLRKLQEETAQDAYSWRELYQMLKARWEDAKEGGRK